MKMIGLESFNADPVGIAFTAERIKETRAVSQADVAPFIQHFPMNVSLSNFSEEPSSKGVDIALEGFATLFKVAAGVALVGILGVCIYNFIRARNSAASAVEIASMLAKMEKSYNTVVDGVRAAPAWQNRSQPFIGSSEIPLPPDGRALGMVGEVNCLEFCDRFFGDEMRFDNMVEGRAVAAMVALGKMSSVTDTLTGPFADYLGDLTKRVQHLRKIITEMPANINSGELDGIVRDLNAIDMSVPRGTVLKLLNSGFDKLLPPPKSGFSNGSAGLLEDRVAALKDVFEQRDRSIYMRSAEHDALQHEWREGNFEKLLGQLPEIFRRAAKMSGAPAETIGRNLVNECEELKKRVATSEFPEAVDARFKELLEEIRLDSLSATTIMDLTLAELRQFFGYTKAIALSVAYLGMAVAAFSRPVQPAQAKRLAHDSAEAAKLFGKIKV